MRIAVVAEDHRNVRALRAVTAGLKNSRAKEHAVPCA